MIARHASDFHAYLHKLMSGLRHFFSFLFFVTYRVFHRLLDGEALVLPRSALIIPGDFARGIISPRNLKFLSGRGTRERKPTFSDRRWLCFEIRSTSLGFITPAIYGLGFPAKNPLNSVRGRTLRRIDPFLIQNILSHRIKKLRKVKLLH